MVVKLCSNLALIDALRTECIVVYSFCEVAREIIDAWTHAEAYSEREYPAEWHWER